MEAADHRLMGVVHLLCLSWRSILLGEMELDQGDCERSGENGVVSLSDHGNRGYDDQYGENDA